jgi:hypothetical protein
MKTLVATVVLFAWSVTFAQDNPAPRNPDECPKYRVTPKCACFPAEDRLVVDEPGKEIKEESKKDGEAKLFRTKEEAGKDCTARLATVRAEGRKYVLRVILVKVREACKENAKIDATCAGGKEQCKPVDTSGFPFPSYLSDTLACTLVGEEPSVSWKLEGKVSFKGNIDVLCDP